jgi:hypothetical protein
MKISMWKNEKSHFDFPETLGVMYSYVDQPIPVQLGNSHSTFSNNYGKKLYWDD